MTLSITTDRLTLTPTSDADIPAFFVMFRDPQAMRFMPTPPHDRIAQTQAWLAGEIGRAGAVYWTIRLKADERPIGYVNYLGETRFPGMGYMVHPDFWGQGIAPEACRAALTYGFEQLGYDRVELWINEDNSASRRVAKKLGFRLKGRIAQKYPHETTHHHMMIFGLRAEEWRGLKSSDTGGLPSLYRVEPVLFVHDIRASTSFYRDKLGFHIDFVYGDPADHAAVSRGEWTGSTVTIQLSRVPAEREITAAGHLYIFAGAPLDPLAEQYRQNGVPIVQEPADRPWGMREFVVRDLDGHTLVFTTHV